MRLSSLVLGAVLVSMSAGSDELKWTSIGKVKSLRLTENAAVVFSASEQNSCNPKSDAYTINWTRHSNVDQIQILLAAMSNGYEVKVVTDGCDDSDMGVAAEVEARLIVRP